METKKKGRASACLSEVAAFHFPGLPLLQFSIRADPSPNEHKKHFHIYRHLKSQTTRQTHVITTLRKLKQEDCYELKASVGYTVNYRTAYTAERNPVF